MKHGYTVERNIQMLIYLMKAHNVKRIIASPGSCNVTFVASLMSDSFFEIYSAPDERSAAYMACGLAAETGEPVALSCTGATASRNYIPGLTEAYYRKLPVLAVTSTQHKGQIGQYVPQVIDRTQPLNDIVNLSVQIPIIHDETDEWSINVALNRALLELRHRGGGPVHIDLTTSYPFYPIDFSAMELPPTRAIYRIEQGQEMPEIKASKIGIFVGNHAPMSSELIQEIDVFCQTYNAVVLCDHTSNYTGKFGISASLVTSQDMYSAPCRKMDILLHIGQVSGAYMAFNPNEIWRINPDGEIRDTYRKLKYVFEMQEVGFFRYYNSKTASATKETYYQEWKTEYDNLFSKLGELPFSNIWVASKTLHRLPPNCYLHLGILNSLRAWNFFPLRSDIKGFSNTGGFGIDGISSSLVGASLANRDKPHYEVIGDLAFFYDLNVLGNRHVSPNVRILLINNGRGTEFRNYTHFASKFGEDTDYYIAAGGHYGKQSKELVKHYAEDLGFEYMSASSKDEYLNHLDVFCSDKIGDKPIIFEVFTNPAEESEALHTIRNLEISAERKAKQIVKNVIGDKGVQTIKKILNK